MRRLLAQAAPSVPQIDPVLCAFVLPIRWSDNRHGNTIDTLAVSESDSAQVVIVGGGVIGCSIAWHLTRIGMRDVMVIERGGLGAGASSLAAGLVSSWRSDPQTLAMVRRTLDDIQRMTRDHDSGTGWHASGSLRVAGRAASAQSLQATADSLARDGVNAEWLDPGRACSLIPWLRAESVHGVVHLPDDGYVDGYRLTMGYAQAARAGGCTIRTDTHALRPVMSGDTVCGVETSRGVVRCECLVDAGGVWAGRMLEWFGASFAATPLRSHYWITSPRVPPYPEHPFVVFPDASAYLRPEVGGLLLGIQERSSRAFDDRCLPENQESMSLTDQSDWDLLASHAPSLRPYIDEFDDLAFRHHIAGLTTYTPDGRFLIGAVAGVNGLLMASGCCGTGLSAAGGIGELVAALASGAAPAVDPRPFDPSRFAGTDVRSAEFIAACVAARASKGRRT